MIYSDDSLIKELDDLFDDETNDFSYITSELDYSENSPVTSSKFHILINKSKSQYLLLDSTMKKIDSIDINPIVNFFTKGFKLRKFKSDVKSDYKAYIRNCKNAHITPDKHIKKMFKNMLFYIDICPDADCNILELLKRNSTKINPNYNRYNTAYYSYLEELAKLYDGNPDKLPFDINFATWDDSLSGNHKYISNSFISNSNNMVRDYIKSHDVSHANDQRSAFLDTYRVTDVVQPVRPRPTTSVKPRTNPQKPARKPAPQRHTTKPVPQKRAPAIYGFEDDYEDFCL